jgi:hypothetical protein
MMSKKKIFILVLFIIISGISSSCFLSPSNIPFDESTYKNSGFMLVQYGDYIYKIGGFDSDGIVTNSVLKANIIVDNSGEVQIGEWSHELSLLAPRAFGAAFAVGNCLYVIGGVDEEGPVSTVFITRIDSYGTLGRSDYGRGYDLAKYWTSQEVKLPEARSHMSLAYSDGRVFLVGGKNNDKIFDSILQARIQIGMSGYIGRWNTSPVGLPKPLYDTSAIINQDKLYVASGIYNDNISNSFFSYKINEYGRLSNLDESFADIPEYLSRPVMVNSLDSIIIGGGYLKDNKINESWYEYDESSWNPLDFKFSGESSTFVQAAGKLIVADSVQDNVLVPFDLELLPKRPNIFPGSGLVRADSIIIGESNSWNELSYIKSPGIDTQLYAEPLDIDGDSQYQFKNSYSFTSTPGIPLSYSVSNIGDIAGRLFLEAPSVKPFSSLLYGENTCYKLSLYVKKDVHIQWEYDDLEYTKPVSIVLFEEDFCTEVLDNDGFPVAEPSSLDTGKSDIMEWYVSLNPGIYYLQITGSSVTSNSKIGFLISEDV